MANLTITIEDEVLKRARMRALEQGTSVNALLREYLIAFAGDDDAKAALAEFIESARRSQTSSGSGGRSWKREDLYDRR